MTAADYQLDFNGTIMGDGTAWDVVSWAGLEEWTTRGTDVVAPTLWGTIPGSTFVDPKVVTITVESVDPTNMLLLEAALMPPADNSATDLVPIRWKFPNREELKVSGRCSRRARNRDLAATAGLTRLTFELQIPDPRAYSAATTSYSIPVFVAGVAGWDSTAGTGVDAGWDSTAGTTVDAGWDSTVGAAGAGLANVTNSGTVNTYPVITFTAPAGMSAWSVTNQTTGQVLAFTQTLNTGESLIADMQIVATGKPGVPISIGGASRYGSWTAPRTPFVLIPGVNLLRFDVPTGDQNAAAALAVQSAYL